MTDATAPLATEGRIESLAERQRRRWRIVVALRIIVFVLFVGGWELGVRAGWLDSFFFGQPSAIVDKLIDWIHNGTAIGPLWKQVWVTIYEAGAGFLIDRRSLAGDRDAILKISIWLQALQIVPVIGMFTVQGTTGVWVCLALSNLLIGSMPIAAFAIITEITPGHHIGKIVALFNLAQNFLGQTIGSAVFAFVGEEVIGGPLGIAWAIILCYPLIMAVSLVLSVMLMRARRRFLARNGCHPEKKRPGPQGAGPGLSLFRPRASGGVAERVRRHRDRGGDERVDQRPRAGHLADLDRDQRGAAALLRRA